jgi:hypothetical protein
MIAEYAMVVHDHSNSSNAKIPKQLGNFYYFILIQGSMEMAQVYSQKDHLQNMQLFSHRSCMSCHNHTERLEDDR